VGQLLPSSDDEVTAGSGREVADDAGLHVDARHPLMLPLEPWIRPAHARLANA
jgi:hypothetical protein